MRKGYILTSVLCVAEACVEEKKMLDATSILLGVLATLVLWLVVHGFTRPNPWAEYNVPVARNLFPFVGNLWGLWKLPIAEVDLKNWRELGKIWIEYQGRNPVLMIADCDMIKKIAIKDFEVFTNHKNIFQLAMETTPVARKFLSVVKDQEWKTLRSNLSPGFSSGKLKKLIPMIDERAKNLVRNFEKEIQLNSGHILVRKKLVAFQLDVIAACAFGTKLNSLDDSENPFVKNAQQLMTPVRGESALFLLPFLFPPLLNQIDLFPKSCIEFFSDAVRRIGKSRDSDAIERGDMLDFMKKQSKVCPELTEEVIIATSVMFFIAGNETVVGCLVGTLYFLALHQDIQDRVYEELKQHISPEGTITSDVVGELKYVEQVINETLRMLPPASRLDRTASRDYDLDGILIPKGSTLNICTQPVHFNPEYYEDPDTFNPERFSRENKSKIHPAAFIPFGVGPRNCIAMRLALEIVITAIARLVLNFRFHKGTYSKFPAKLAPSFFTGIEATFQIGCEKRA